MRNPHSHSSPTATTTICSSVTRFERAINNTNFEELNLGSLKDALKQIHSAEQAISAAKVAIAQRAKVLENAGQVAEVATFMSGQGSKSRKQAKKEAQRAEAVTTLEAAGFKLDIAATPPENLDTLATVSSKLSEEDLKKLDKASLIKHSQGDDVDTFSRHIKRQVEKVKTSRLQDYKARRDASEVVHWFDYKSQMGHVHGKFDAARYEAIAKVIDRKTTKLANTAKSKSGSTSNICKDPNLAAQGLYEIFNESFKTELAKQSRPAASAEILVICDEKTLTDSELRDDSICETELGADLAIETLQRLACDSIYRKVTVDKSGQPLNVGRKYRTATDTQWTATKATHKTCAWDDCDTRISWCQLHHVEEWTDGGKTDLNNLVPLCSQHHHKVHEGKWHIRKLPDQSLEHLRPDGTVYRVNPPPVRSDD